MISAVVRESGQLGRDGIACLGKYMGFGYAKARAAGPAHMPGARLHGIGDFLQILICGLALGCSPPIN